VLNADDYQHLLSFLALDFSLNIAHLENNIANVSNWMSSNFRSLNPSKTEFLLFGLPQQLYKLNNPTIHLLNNIILLPVESAHNLLFLILLIKLLLALLLLFLFALKLTSVTLFYFICQQIKRIVFNLSSTLLLVLSQIFKHTLISQNWSNLRSLLSFPVHHSTWSSVITRSCPSLTSCLKLQTDISIIPLMLYGTVFRLIYVTLLITSLHL